MDFFQNQEVARKKTGVLIGYFLLAVVLIIATVAMQALRSRWDAMKLAHWPCPRCHSEWPGTKREKDPRCAVCGLKLRQMAP